MSQFLVTIHRPNDFNPSIQVSSSMRREIDALNDEMVAAGVRVFVGGLQPTRTAMSIHRNDDGEQVSNGPYAKSGEYMDGLWIIDVADMQEALEWGRRAAQACQANVEVRPFY